MNNTRQARQSKGNRIAFGILIIIVSLFCFLCDVRAFGGVGRMVYGFLVGFFGLASYAYSIMGIVIGICIVFGIRPKMRASRAFIYFGMLILAIFALHIYTSSAHILGAKYGEYLMNCYNNTNTAGGMLYGVVAFPLMKAVTTVGALVIASVGFFVLGFFAILPSLKRNTVYTAASKEERNRTAKAPRFARKQKRYVEPEAPRQVEALSSPALTDFSQPSGSGQNLFVVDVAGDPLQNGNKKYKGADGYRPLYPNFRGAYEDELTTRDQQPIAGAEIYSPRNLAKNVLFARDEREAQENLRRFNTASNPNDALNDFSRQSQSSTVKRNELKQKLGIDTTSDAYREEYLSRYRLRENLSEPQTAPVTPVTPVTPVQAVPEEKPVDTGSDTFDFKAEFQNLKAEQVKRFGEMYVKPEFESTAYDTPDSDAVVEAENVKKEVVKPTRTRSDFDVNPTVQKAESAVEKQVNVGLQGALNRALSGEEQQEKPAPDVQEFEAEAYAQPSFVDTPAQEFEIPKAVAVAESPRKSIKDLDDSGYKPQPAKVPRAFEESFVEKQSTGYEMPKASLERGNKYVDNSATYGGDVPSAPAPRQQQVTGDPMSRSAIQSTTAIAKQSAKNIEDAEMQARIKNIKQALKESPKMSEFELEAARKEEKSRASQSRVDKMARDLEKIDTSKQRVSQINMEQAIEQAEEQEKPRRPYVAPPLNLLNPPVPEMDQNEDYEGNKAKIIETLEFFNIKAEVIDIMVGPTFTMYKLTVEMPRGKSVGYIMSAERDLTMKLRAGSVRIIAPIPGEDAVGIEVPNKNRRNVNLSEVIGSAEYQKAKSPATLALGVNLYGKPCFVDVKKLPHALIAGSTGAGKSCCINSAIISLLYKASPEDVRLIMIDPKRVELSMYAGIPHLLMDEIICDTDKAIRALNWAIEEMNRRIKFLSEVGFQNIDDYNENCAKSGTKKIPRIIIIVDEFADLMSTGKKAVEDTVNRIARLARAAGIHLLLATQRPSVDVISGTIKNNFPSRMAFKVTSSFDSKTMLDQVGAEKLLGWGDMLFMLSGQPLERMQGAFISNSEIKNVIDFVKANNDSYFDNNIKDAIFKEAPPEKSDSKGGGDEGKGGDTPPELFKALEIGIQLREENNAPISVSLLQRKLGLGWPKAARIYDMMDERGYLSVDENDPKKKKVNLTYDELAAIQAAENGEGDEE